MTVACVSLLRTPSLQTPSLGHLVNTLVALVALGLLALVVEVLSQLPLFPEAALALHCPTALVEQVVRVVLSMTVAVGAVSSLQAAALGLLPPLLRPLHQ